MIILTLFQFLLIIHELLYLIILNSWLFLYKLDFFESPNPLFLYIVSLFNNALIIFYIIYSGTSFVFFIIFIIYMILKVFSILDLIFYYDSRIDYFSVIMSILIIFIISLITTIITIKFNN